MSNILTFILEYVYQEPSEYFHGGCYWDTLEEAGDEQLLEYFHDYNTVADVLYDEANIPDPESTTKFEELLTAAAEGRLPVLGDIIFLQIEIWSEHHSSWDGDDYDEGWNILALVWNADHMQKCMQVLEEMSETVSAYGLCKCGDIVHHDHTDLGRYAQERKLCYEHAALQYDREQAILEDPLYDLRKSARRQAERLTGNIPAWCENFIASATKGQLEKYIQDSELEYQTWLRTWEGYQ